MQQRNRIKIKFIKKPGWISAKVSVPKQYIINTEQYSSLAKESSACFFLFSIQKGKHLFFNAQYGEVLEEYLGTCNNQETSRIKKQIKDAISLVRQIGLYPENIILDPKHIIYNKTTGKIALIYIAATSPILNNSFKLFDDEFGGLSMGLTASKPSFVPANSTGQVRQNEETAIADDDERTELAFSESSSPNKHRTNAFDSASDEEQTELDYKVSEQYFQQRSRQGTFGTIPEDDRTEICEEFAFNGKSIQAKKNKGRLALVRQKTGETIWISKSPFRIGKNGDSVDYAISDNAAVSRSHADIVEKNGCYYVIDLRSKNKTYVNNRIVMAERETKLESGDILKFANEEFVVQLVY